MPKYTLLKIASGIDVYLERRKSREFVGRLVRSRLENKPAFEFTYHEPYLLKKNAIPLGPEFPLTQQKFLARRLFPSFEDRIPSRQNPAYPEYCKSFGVSPEESDQLVLLSTIGRKGPSSFVFEPTEDVLPDGQEVSTFRKNLGMTIREFASAFDTSPASIQKLELGRGSGKELLKRLQIYVRFPEIAVWELKKNRAKIHDDKYQQVIRRIQEQGEKNKNIR